jgi:hypothetical protein
MTAENHIDRHYWIRFFELDKTVKIFLLFTWRHLTELIYLFKTQHKKYKQWKIVAMSTSSLDCIPEV